MRDRAPAYRDPALHFDALRLVALREGDRNKETQRTREKFICAHLRTCTQPAKLFAAGAPLLAHTQPALRTGLMAPAWRLLHVFRNVIRDL